MQAESILKFKNYIVKKIEFTMNDQFINNNEPINITPKFTRKISKLDKDNAIVSLNFEIDQKNSPFFINVIIESLFELENWESKELKGIMLNNTVAILFPYLREIVTSITAKANITPYILPIMNINSLFEDK